MFRSSLWLKYADEAPGAEEATGATLAVSLVPGAGQTAAWVRAVARGEGEAEGAEMRFSSNEGRHSAALPVSQRHPVMASAKCHT